MSGDSKTGAKSGFASPYVVLKRIPQFFLPRVGRGSRHYVMTKRATQVGLLQRKIPVHFATQKAPETYRVFALGGSASLGWPHAFTKSYPHFLQHKLKKLLPAREPEVHNLGGMMFPTYKVRILFEEIIEYELANPDERELEVCQATPAATSRFVFRDGPPKYFLEFSQTQSHLDRSGPIRHGSGSLPPQPGGDGSRLPEGGYPPVVINGSCELGMEAQRLRA